jgi:hypothetical protein
VPDTIAIGLNMEQDRERYAVSPSGITVLGKGIIAV